MLIRISGGSAGIKDYLENGRKQGREQSRDELDERVILAGDLDATEAIMLGMETEGEKYLHITLAFKEDEISRETLQNIVRDLEQFAFSAYQSDEYSFYAEAHMPKIKSYVDEKSGEFVERKPHIHIVIPKTNLLSGNHLNPFGVVDQNERFIDAAQEHLNNKYGLASPKENRRIEFTGASEMISRYKGDLFKGDKGKELKERILSELLDRGIEDFSQFKKLAAEYGIVSTGNSKDREDRYLKVTPPGATKAARLDSYVFSREFVELPTAEKQTRLAANLTADAQRRYEIAGEVRRDPGHIAKQLTEWHKTRAKELKYLNSGSKNEYQAYRKAAPDERQQLLAERENRFYTKHRKDDNHGQEKRSTDRTPGADRFNRDYGFKQPAGAERVAGTERSTSNRQFGPEPFGQDTSPQSLNSVRVLSRLGMDGHTGRSEVLLPDHARNQLENERTGTADGLRRPADRQPAVGPTGRQADSVVSQLSRDQSENNQARSAGRTSELQEAKQNLDARRLLAELSQSHGVIAEKYQVTKAKDGSDRIKCGTRNLNVSDFLTKELNLPWKEAEKTLRESYGRQTGRQVQREHRQEPRRQLWSEFQAGRGERQQQRTRQWDDLRSGQGERLNKVKTEFYAKRSRIQGDKSLTGAQRKAAMSLARMERITKEAAVKEHGKIESAQFKATQRVPAVEQYRDFLNQKAQGGDEQALAELRRMKPEAAEKGKDNAAQVTAGEPQAKREVEPLHRSQAITYQVHRNGDVTYQRAGQDMLRDEGRRVQMLKTDEATIETGLRLAQQKFGSKLALAGPPDFQEKAARIAAEAGLKVEFTDQRLNQIMGQRRAELAADKAREQEARRLGQEFAKQRETAGKGKDIPAAPKAYQQPENGSQVPAPAGIVPTEYTLPNKDGGRSTGPIVAVDENHVYQRHGVKHIQHDRKDFNEALKPGDVVQVQYHQGRATVENKAQGQAKRQDLDASKGKDQSGPSL